LLQKKKRKKERKKKETSAIASRTESQQTFLLNCEPEIKQNMNKGAKVLIITIFKFKTGRLKKWIHTHPTT
jgi:hypothetical protein